MAYRIDIVSSGGGPTNSAGVVNSLAEAKLLVEQLEARFDQWVKDGMSTLPEGDALQYYEGCDIYAHDLDTGKWWMYDPMDTFSPEDPEYRPRTGPDDVWESQDW